MSWLSKALHGIGHAVSGIGHFLGSKILPVVSKVIGFIPGVGTLAGPILATIGNLIKPGGGLKAAIQGLPTALLTALPAAGGMGGVLGNVANALKSVPGLGSVVSAIQGAGSYIGNVLQPVFKGIGTAAGTVGDFLKQNVGQPIVSAVKSLLPSGTGLQSAVNAGQQAMALPTSVGGLGGGLIDPNDPLKTAMNIGTIFQGVQSGVKGEEYANRAAQDAQQQYAARLPVQNLAIQRLLANKNPDLSSAFAGTNNPFAFKPPQIDQTGATTSPAAPLPTGAAPPPAPPISFAPPTPAPTPVPLPTPPNLGVAPPPVPPTGPQPLPKAFTYGQPVNT